jgi:hypothetical protein
LCDAAQRSSRHGMTQAVEVERLELRRVDHRANRDLLGRLRTACNRRARRECS